MAPETLITDSLGGSLSMTYGIICSKIWTCRRAVDILMMIWCCRMELPSPEESNAPFKPSERSTGTVYQGWRQRGFSVFLMKFGTASVCAESRGPLKDWLGL